jgi:Ca2+-binding EF-hand superfamily protein
MIILFEESSVKQVLTIVATALLSTAAFAQDQKGGSAFDILDADHNGSINREEAQAHPTVAQAFTSADADGNGMITRQEFDASFTTTTPPTDAPPPTVPQ